MSDDENLKEGAGFKWFPVRYDLIKVFLLAMRVQVYCKLSLFILVFSSFQKIKIKNVLDFSSFLGTVVVHGHIGKPIQKKKK